MTYNVFDGTSSFALSTYPLFFSMYTWRRRRLFYQSKFVGIVLIRYICRLLLFFLVFITASHSKSSSDLRRPYSVVLHSRHFSFIRLFFSLLSFILTAVNSVSLFVAAYFPISGISVCVAILCLLWREQDIVKNFKIIIGHFFASSSLFLFFISTAINPVLLFCRCIFSYLIVKTYLLSALILLIGSFDP